MLIWSILVAWLLTDALATYGVLHNRRTFTTMQAAHTGPAAALVVAIKGVSDVTPLFLQALQQQEYRNFRLIFALQSSADAALALVTRLQQQLAGVLEVSIVIAGAAARRAQKVHNLLAALATLRVDDRIVVFADADIIPGTTWLSDLIRPIVSSEAAASCGYRWQLPQTRSVPNLIVAAADMSIATAVRSRRWNLCWAGSVALDRDVLDRLNLSALWERAASDDLTLTSALRSRGLRIYAVPFVLVPTPVSQTWISMLRFIHRQYLLVRVYAPRHWLLAAWALLVPTIGAAGAVILLARGRWLALIFLVVSLCLLQVRLQIRRTIARMVLTDSDMALADATVNFARWCWPFIHLVHVVAFASSTIGRRFTWAGIRYRLVGARVEVVSQPVTSAGTISTGT